MIIPEVTMLEDTKLDELHAEALEADYPDEGAHPTRRSGLDAEAAIDRLRVGNAAFLRAHRNTGDISPLEVERLFSEGQAPFACVVSCADSRVVPEHIFMAGLGELFCIRAAGNALDAMGLASCLYAVEHLGTKLVLVLGHTHCGAIESGMELACRRMRDDDADEALPATLRPLVCRMADAIGAEQDPHRAAVLNVEAGMDALRADPDLAHLCEEAGVAICGAIYHTHSGEVDFL
jgi:carbonic anhydrase